MKIFSTISLIIVVLLGLTFAALNAAPVAINFYFIHKSLPLALLMVFTIGIGGVIGLLAAGLVVIRLKKENRSLRKKIKLVEKEITNLRVMPLKDSH